MEPIERASTGQLNAVAMRRAHETYNAVHTKLDVYGKLVMEYMRHPDADKEKLWKLRQRYLTMFQEWIAIRNALRAQYPRPASSRLHTVPHPWNLNP